jgi:endoribonuclease Dicer
MILTKSGQRFLDLACVEFIFKAHPEAGPGWLTKHRRVMVSNKFLGAVSVILGFHKRTPVVAKQEPAINGFSTKILLARERSDVPNFWTDPSILAPPKVLPDVLVAFIGALFVDSESNYGVVEEFFNTYVRPYFMDMSLYDSFVGAKAPTFLAKKLTNIGCQQWGWETGTKSAEDDRKVFEEAILIHGVVFAVSSADSAEVARVFAAEAALKKLRELGPEELHELCNCPKSHKEREHEKARKKFKRKKFKQKKRRLGI